MARLSIFEVISGLWCVQRGRSTSYIVKLSPGAVLVDTGPESNGADVMMGLQVARVGMASVRGLLITHAHRHASSGAAVLVGRTGTRPFASPTESRRLGVPEEPGPVGKLLGERARAPVVVPEPVSEGDRLFEHFEVIETPGHTEGHLAFYFRPARALFAGDALAAGRAERPDLVPSSKKKCLEQDAGLVLRATGGPLSEPLTRER